MNQIPRYFLERDLVHIVASDMHNLDGRPPYMKEAYEIVSKKYGQDKARELFILNPQKIIKDQII